VNDTVRRATALGGTVIAQPFVVSGIARIALILDSVGALIGLWEPIELNMNANGQGSKNG
jgi:predicted enzyme related to lactoylglutathione lyase